MRRAGVYFPGLTARGGAERLALTLALALSGMGWDVAIYSDVQMDARQLSIDLGEDVSGLRLVTLQDRPVGRLPREVARLIRLASHATAIRKHDLELFINASFKSQLPGCGRRNVYYCHFPHNLDPFAESGLRGLYQKLTSLADRLLVTRAPIFLETYNEVWANSEFTARHVRGRWDLESKVLYPACEQIPGRDKERVIAAVGRFQAMTPGSPYKAQDILVREFAEMKDLHEAGWRLELVGGLKDNLADQAYYRQLVSEAEGSPVRLHPNATHAFIRELYARASIYWHAQGFGADDSVEPQTQEHFGITTVEAMSAGAIPVVYGTAGPLEVVRGVPRLEVWYTPQELATITRRWCKADQVAAAVRDACRIEAARFDREAFEASLAELLEPGGTLFHVGEQRPPG